MRIGRNASKWIIIGVIFQVIGTILYCTGYSTNYWMTSELILGSIKYNVGLFKMRECLSGACTTKDIDDAYKNSVATGTMALSTITLVAMVVCTIMYICYVVWENARSFCLAITIVSIDYGSATFIIIYMIMWISQVPSNFYPSWSFGLTVAAAGTFLIAGSLLLFDVWMNGCMPNRKAKITHPAPRPKELQTAPYPMGHHPVAPSFEFYPAVETPGSYKQPLFYLRDSPSPNYSDGKGYHPSPRPERSTPRTPQVIRVQMRSNTPIHSSRTPSIQSSGTRSTHSSGSPLSRYSQALTHQSSRSSTRRYGTPKFSQRYDYRAR